MSIPDTADTTLSKSEMKRKQKGADKLAKQQMPIFRSVPHLATAVIAHKLVNNSRNTKFSPLIGTTEHRG